MDSLEYEFIKSRLNTPNDVDLLNERMDLPKDMLFNVLARKIVRKVMRDYYKIKRKEDLMLRDWKKGESFCEISNKMGFPAILTASFILLKKGFSRGQFRSLLTDPESISDKRIQKEIKEALAIDFVYSPTATESQSKNGKMAEDKIDKWLSSQKLKFITERESRLIHEKTPDFLLDKPMKIDSREINWVESKASFGSPNEMKRNYRKQLKPYLDLFGPGMVVYWYGFVDDIYIDDRILTVSRDFFGEKIP